MSRPALRLLRVVMRGPQMPTDSETLGGVLYAREKGTPQGIYFTVAKPTYMGDVRYPRRNDEDMQITVVRGLLSKRLGVEFCGRHINILVAAASEPPTIAGAVLRIRPLLFYFEGNFNTD